MNVKKMTGQTIKAPCMLGVVLGFALMGSAHGAVVTLLDENSTATFHTEVTDGGTIGQNGWTVEGVDQLAQNWLWFRTDSMINEAPLQALNHVIDNAIDTDLDNQDDMLLVRYDNSGGGFIPGSFEIDLRYSLVGGSLGSGTSNLTEVVSFKNTGDEPLTVNLFEFASWNMNGSTADDVVESPGILGNTLVVNDIVAGIMVETVATSLPTAFQVGDANALLSSLSDGAITNLNNDAGPYGPGAPGGVGWAYQWAYVVNPDQTVLISKGLNIHSYVIPEPSTLGLLGLAGLLLMRRRG